MTAPTPANRHEEADTFGMSQVELARVYVPPHERLSPEGERIHVSGYWRKQQDAGVAIAAAMMFNRANSRDPEITGMMRRLADENGGEMEGLEFRVKQPKSLRRKIQKHIDTNREGTSDPIEVATKLSDPLRYTMVYSEDKYTAGARNTLDSLMRQGYTIQSKNYWVPGDPYQGLNVALQTPDGFNVELQFHTRASLEVKERNHPLYERFRKSDDNAERRRLYMEMARQASLIPVPEGIRTIPTEMFEPYEDLPPIPDTFDN